jgi:sugar O-acyltransferase (sialic acid O-acetyltransferase NeuD family)
VRVAGYLNDRLPTGEELEGNPVVGSLSDVARYLEEGFHFINTIYRIDGQESRLALFEGLGIPDDRMATFVHPLAYVAPGVQLGPGAVVMPLAMINPGVFVGRGSLVMVGVSIAHDTVVGEYCHLSAQACVGAHVSIGRGVHVGLNATIREHVTLGEHSALGMGSVLLGDPGPGEIWAGVPAKFLRMAES